jgi:ATP-dependent DNA ligase
MAASGGVAPQVCATPESGELQPMEARLVAELPSGPGWQYEPKWDGFRCLASRTGSEVEMKAKSGKSLSRYFPEVVEMLRTLPRGDFILDGELVIPEGNTVSFDALQMRLHPAESRIRKLSAETPAIFVAFDCLMTERAGCVMDLPLTARREALEDFFGAVKPPARLRLSPYTRDHEVALGWLEDTGGSLDGVVAKPLDEPYQPGKRAMLKVKRIRTADCVVGGFRYEQDSDQVGSLLLGLYNKEGKLDHVGFTSAIADDERQALTRKLESLIEPPGFTGNAPGGPSRWSTDRSGDWQPLRPELVVEVGFDQVTNGRFRHGTRLVRWRPDKAPRQCTREQIAPVGSNASFRLSPE